MTRDWTVPEVVEQFDHMTHKNCLFTMPVELSDELVRELKSSVMFREHLNKALSVIMSTNEMVTVLSHDYTLSRSAFIDALAKEVAKADSDKVVFYVTQAFVNFVVGSPEQLVSQCLEELSKEADIRLDDMVFVSDDYRVSVKLVEASSQRVHVINSVYPDDMVDLIAGEKRFKRVRDSNVLRSECVIDTSAHFMPKKNLVKAVCLYWGLLCQKYSREPGGVTVDVAEQLIDFIDGNCRKTLDETVFKNFISSSVTFDDSVVDASDVSCILSFGDIAAILEEAVIDVPFVEDVVSDPRSYDDILEDDSFWGSEGFQFIKFSGSSSFPSPASLALLRSASDYMPTIIEYVANATRESKGMLGQDFFRASSLYTDGSTSEEDLTLLKHLEARYKERYGVNPDKRVFYTAPGYECRVLSKKLNQQDGAEQLESMLKEFFEGALTVEEDGDDEGGPDSIAVMKDENGRVTLDMTNLIKSLTGETTQKTKNSKNNEQEVVEWRDLKHLESQLSSSIIGQDEAIEKIVDGLAISAAGLNQPNKPLKTFLFLGPTGVGKTETSKLIAEHAFEKPVNVIRLDMSEYASDHEVAKLFGAPPGYAGYSEGGTLVSAVSEHPQSVIILDEVEKAHPRAWDPFLQVFDAGRMTSGSGETVDFSQCIIIMTSNIGVKEAAKKTAGFASHDDSADRSESVIMRELENTFRPEFLNRIDDIVFFKKLDHESMLGIVKKELNAVAQRAEARGVDASFTSGVAPYVMRNSSVDKYGAREVQRVVTKTIATPIAKFIVKNRKAQSVRVSVRNGVVSLNSLKKES